MGSCCVRSAREDRSNPAALAAVNAEVREDGSGSESSAKNGVPRCSMSNRCVKAAFNAVAFHAQS